MKPAILANWVFLGLLAAGCADAPAPESEPGSQVSGGATTQTEIGLGGSQHVILLNLLPPNAEPMFADWNLVRFGFTKTQMESHLEHADCQSMSLPGEQYYWLTVWNRTSLVYYDERPINWSRKGATTTSDRELVDGIEARIPANSMDPPYLLFAGATCAGYGQLEYQAWQCHGGSRDVICPGGLPSDLVAENGLDAKTFETARLHNVTVDIKIPAGGLSAEATFPLLGPDFFVLGGNVGNFADHPTGQAFGDLYTYEPEARCAGAASWVWHYSSTPIDRDVYARHGLTGAPGHYRMRVELASPFPDDTIWRVGPYQVYAWQPSLREFGFEYPPTHADHAVCPGRS